MCVALPGKVVAINDKTATVDFNGNLVDAMMGLVDVNLKDYVLVHAGCIIQIMQENDALELIDLMEEVGAL